MIAVDSSALVAIAIREPERAAFIEVLRWTDAAWISPMNMVETGMVLLQREFISGWGDLDGLLASYGVERREDVALTSAAFDAFFRFGKGRHPARLNLGDCFAYALAKALDVPLLYKGGDFAMTDIRSALQPT